MPCFDAVGVEIPSFPDVTVTEIQVNGWVDGITNIPQPLRALYFQCVRPFWDAIHFDVGGDNVFLTLASNGSIKLSSLPFDYGVLESYPGLDYPP